RGSRGGQVPPGDREPHAHAAEFAVELLPVQNPLRGDLGLTLRTLPVARVRDFGPDLRQGRLLWDTTPGTLPYPGSHPKRPGAEKWHWITLPPTPASSTGWARSPRRSTPTRRCRRRPCRPNCCRSSTPTSWPT